MADKQAEDNSKSAEPMTPGLVVSPGQPEAAPAAPPQSEPTQTEPVAPEASHLQGDENGITWTASEFIAHEKDTSWYAALAGVAVLLAAVVALVTKDFITSGVIIFCAILLGIYGSRQPRQLQYGISEQGVSIGDKFRSYGEFRSFSVVDEGAFSSIVFMPLKRFAPLTTIYYAPEDEEAIVNILMDRLPFEEHRLDLLDQFLRRIRF